MIGVMGHLDRHRAPTIRGIEREGPNQFRVLTPFVLDDGDHFATSSAASPKIGY
jgi:hypothetical protein